jgi:hypothetical protein
MMNKSKLVARRSLSKTELDHRQTNPMTNDRKNEERNLRSQRGSLRRHIRRDLTI